MRDGLPHQTAVDRCDSLTAQDIADLAEATNAAIIEGGGFGWLEPQPAEVLERHFRGVLAAPDRDLFLARLDGRVVGSAQLVRPPRNNEAQAATAQLTHAYIAPYARGHGLARGLITHAEDWARANGIWVLNLDVRSSQAAAIQIFEGLGYRRWGTHPAYARVRGQLVAGFYYYKALVDAARLRRGKHMFTLYPAIDLKGGQVVRLKRGEMADATVYGTDPGAQAAAFATQGFSWVHVVDLDGAFAGKPANVEAVRSILAAAPMPVQLGGGIRSMETAEAWIEAGVARIILGSVAVKDPDFVREACRAFPGKVALGIDARGGMVATEGWAEVSDIPAIELAHRFEDAGAAAIIFTDIDRDGMLGGSNVAATRAMAGAVGVPVIASGGVSSLEEIAELRAAPEGIAGAILGRALYDGRLLPAEALAAARGA
ncbi:1-(5-phosphoribosyl)-5-[(5-phosphoribosylamino)methylideneamino]imidazole-4-carboxamide isomerase [Rhodovarius crocodyli]|uniref:1-(5-phosphoribosyl)-5-[(5-phosphoribosylamino)methylideneamino] imidazole-4-carboxamide isomerase n=1 Tax=Rhodovarius crocodyli TaxID=1979269 RepID=A0A437MMK4_9PROT|nr:1-(5-phosphoribosyl)-5-[(5-phosphoribosylamino)methylideneamino]imidazole-4-carboxamide isomerase [Rhodovarius crocodyli]RVT98852.1 1-(5-phosphoribosyl)-5-[(5-phosphoribosylamino)methylideneamino]imidazole-4-carboxamide isomerase [Rhodovarius crocodyli]